MNLSLRIATVQDLVAEQPGMAVWRVDIDGVVAEAVAYAGMVGPLAPGGRVVVNTTAVALALGTGGQHFIVAQVDAEPDAVPLRREDGHILKLRYTPLQGRVLAAEEEASPHHAALREAASLAGTPVVCLGLHSQLAPAAAAVKAADAARRVAYVMTDGAALPLAYSRQVAQLRTAGLLDVTVTAGQAFGGDLEAVNLYSALVTAAVAGGADVIIAGQGPGNAGTATALGFSGAEQATLLNAAAALNGVPIAVPRISFADPRPRHRGVSHHTLTVLHTLTLAAVQVPLPALPGAQAAVIREQLAATWHELATRDGAPGITRCQAAGIPLRSMGRGYDDDPAYFLAASAAGRLAVEYAPA